MSAAKKLPTRWLVIARVCGTVVLTREASTLDVPAAIAECSSGDCEGADVTVQGIDDEGVEMGREMSTKRWSREFGGEVRS